MATTLQQILGGRNLTGVIQGVVPGIPDGLLPGAFLTPSRTVEGDYGTYLRVEGTRQTARIAQYGSPSQQRQLKGVSEVSVKLLHTVESVFHKPAVLVNLTAAGDERKQRLGEEEIARRTGEFKRLFANLRLAAVYSMLARGAIHFDGEGNLLGDDTGARVTVDYGVPAGNRGMLDVFGEGPILADWSAAEADLSGQLATLRRAARRLTGYPIRHAFYGAAVADYVLSNTGVREVLSASSRWQHSAAGGEIPDGLLGLHWHPVGEAFYVDAADTCRDFFDDDTVVFTPEPSPEWYELIEGTYPVPTDVGAVAGDAPAAVENVSLETGMFSYAVVTSDPVSIKHVAGDTFLPVLKVPSAVFIANVEA